MQTASPWSSPSGTSVIAVVGHLARGARIFGASGRTSVARAVSLTVVAAGSETESAGEKESRGDTEGEFHRNSLGFEARMAVSGPKARGLWSEEARASHRTQGARHPALVSASHCPSSTRPRKKQSFMVRAACSSSRAPAAARRAPSSTASRTSSRRTACRRIASWPSRSRTRRRARCASGSSGLAGAEVVRDLWVGTFHAVCSRLLRRYHERGGARSRVRHLRRLRPEGGHGARAARSSASTTSVPAEAACCRSSVARSARDAGPGDPKSELTASAREAVRALPARAARARMPSISTICSCT